MASELTVECTATVAIPSSFAARRIRKSDFAAIGDQNFLEHLTYFLPPPPDHEQRLAISTGCAILDQYGGHGAGFMRDDVVERLHRLDQQHLLAAGDMRADLDKGLGVGARPQIDGADHRRLENVRRRYARRRRGPQAGPAWATAIRPAGGCA